MRRPALSVEAGHSRIADIGKATADRPLKPQISRAMNGPGIFQNWTKGALADAFIHQQNGIGLGVHASRLRGNYGEAGSVITGCIGLVSPGMLRNASDIGVIHIVDIDENVLIIGAIHKPSQAKLFLIAQTNRSTSFGFGFGQRGQQHRRQDGNDGDDDE